MTDPGVVRPAAADVAAWHEEGVCTCTTVPAQTWVRVVPDVNCGLSTHRVAARHAAQDDYDRNHNPEEP